MISLVFLSTFSHKGSERWPGQITARMVEVKVINKTDRSVVLKESNAGIPLVLANLSPAESASITVDPNATYREYIMITLPNNEQLRQISSDEMQDLKAIEIYIDGQGKWYCEDISKHANIPNGNIIPTWLRSGCTLPPKTWSVNNETLKSLMCTFFV